MLAEGGRRLAREIGGKKLHETWTRERCLRDIQCERRSVELGDAVMRFWVHEIRDDLTSCLSRALAWVEEARGTGTVCGLSAAD